MEQESFGLLRAQEVRDARISGEVRIAVTEGLGTYWLLPKLIEYQRLNPLLVIDLRCAMHSVDVMRMEADIAIQLVRPSSADLIVTRVGTLHTMPMASPKFLEKFGIPRDLTTLQQSRIVLQEAEQLTTQSEYEALFDNHPKSGFVSVINNAGSAHLWSIIRGAGIGMLPTYVPAIGCNVEPLNVDIRRRYDVWLTFHPEMNKSPRVRQTLDWIIESFRPEKYPWFREEFIHPKDFDRLYFGGDLPKFEEEHFRVK
jgi:DNA-binding transcriptional LysR family regulator